MTTNDHELDLEAILERVVGRDESMNDWERLRPILDEDAKVADSLIDRLEFDCETRHAWSQDSLLLQAIESVELPTDTDRAATRTPYRKVLLTAAIALFGVVAFFDGSASNPGRTDSDESHTTTESDGTTQSQPIEDSDNSLVAAGNNQDQQSSRRDDSTGTISPSSLRERARANPDFLRRRLRSLHQHF
ncbi:MAG: hypothetical protein AAF196_17900 [Planctomycetota bacterium]